MRPIFPYPFCQAETVNLTGHLYISKNNINLDNGLKYLNRLLGVTGFYDKKTAILEVIGESHAEKSLVLNHKDGRRQIVPIIRRDISAAHVHPPNRRSL